MLAVGVYKCKTQTDRGSESRRQSKYSRYVILASHEMDFQAESIKQAKYSTFNEKRSRVMKQL